MSILVVDDSDLSARIIEVNIARGDLTRFVPETAKKP